MPRNRALTNVMYNVMHMLPQEKGGGFPQIAENKVLSAKPQPHTQRAVLCPHTQRGSLSLTSEAAVTPAGHPAHLPLRDPQGRRWEGDQADALRERHRGLQFQQGHVRAPLCRQALVELGVADDLSHICQGVMVIESQPPNLNPEAIGLPVLPGERDQEPLRGASGAGQSGSSSRAGAALTVSPLRTRALPTAPLPSALCVFPSPPLPGGLGLRGSPLGAVGCGQHPLLVDEGAPTEVLPQLQLLIVPSDADLPRPSPSGGIVRPHGATLLPP